jgi:hypothetical protein
MVQLYSRNYDLQSQSSIEKIPPSNIVLPFKGRRFEPLSLLDLQDKVLAAISNQDWTWKKLVKNSLKAIEEF